MIHEKQSIDNVTTKILDKALRMCNIEINYQILDKIIDLVELIEIKGDLVSIKNICNLQEEWETTEKTRLNDVFSELKTH